MSVGFQASGVPRRPDYEGQTHLLWTSSAPLLLVVRPRGGRTRFPSAFSFPAPLLPLCRASISGSTGPLEGTERLSSEATCLLPPPAQPRGWYALACILCFSGTQRSRTTFKLCREATTVLHLSPGLWLHLTYCVCCHFSHVFWT